MLPTTVCAFDIETIPDVSGFCKINKLSVQNQEEGFDLMNLHRRAMANTEFPKHHLNKIVAISVCVMHKDKFKVSSLGETDSSEKQLLEKFFRLIERYQPTLVSWNGSGFDLAVLQYRALIHGVSAGAYWDVGYLDSGNKWNNYTSRYHWKHIDLMDVLAGYQARSSASLDNVAKLCGFPGKLETDGSAVLDLYKDNNLKAIRDYCETDVLNTFFVYLRFELSRGVIHQKEYQLLIDQLKNYIASLDKRHLNEFISLC